MQTLVAAASPTTEAPAVTQGKDEENEVQEVPSTGLDESASYKSIKELADLSTTEIDN